MRIRENFDFHWMYKIGEEVPVPKTGTKSAFIGGMTNSLPGEKGEGFLGAERILKMLNRIMPTGDDADEREASAATSSMFTQYAIRKHSLDGWKTVTLPHDFRLDYEFTRKLMDFAQGYIPNGVCYYRKVFSIPKDYEGKRIVIEFDGVMRAASVWYNGCFLGDHYSGYYGFQYDVTELSRYGDEEGDNVILVRCDTTTGNEGWWYEGGGIYRHTWLTVYDPLHVDRWGVYIRPTVNGTLGNTRIETSVCNETDKDCTFTVRTTIIDPAGTAVAAVESPGNASAQSTTKVNSTVAVENISLWDIDAPNLYTAKTEILADGQVVDDYTTTYGYRTAEYTTDGFILNGRKVPLWGACVHQDFAGVGTGLSDAVQAYKIKRLKDMGCNAYRSAHNPATIELLDECDRQGMMVLDENRLIETTPHRIENLIEFIKRGRNHPSVFAWSMSNEETISGSFLAKRMLKKLIKVAKNLDDTRPYFSAEAFISKEDALIYATEIFDAVGLNYSESTSLHVTDEDRYLYMTKVSPEIKCLNTENVAWYSTRGIYEDNYERGHCSSYGTRYCMMGGEGGEGAGGTARPWLAYRYYEKYPATGGFFMWTGFDYRGEPTPLKETQNTANFGAMDLCGFAKDIYYYYQSVFIQTPMIHIMPHWNWQEGKTVEVRLYTNCEEADLILNHTSLGRKKKSKEEDWIAYEVSFVPGRLEAVGYRNGEKVAEDAKETAGAPAKLCLEVNRQALCADGTDIGFVTVKVCDTNGILVPDAEDMISIQVEGCGELAGLGNGDPGCRANDRHKCRNAFGGMMMALIRTSAEAGIIKVVASAKGLMPAEIELTVE